MFAGLALGQAWCYTLLAGLAAWGLRATCSGR